MRPVNLIPADQLRARSGARTGPLAYLVVGALALLLVGVVAIVLSSNQISESESELASLNARKVAAQARAERLAPYAEFQKVERERTQTVRDLADSRFAWPRILRQLSLVIPRSVFLTHLTGLAGKGAAEGGGGAEGGSGGSDLATQITGPSLSMEGCAVNQKRVASLITAIRHIDGVTRVGLSDSTRSKDSGSGEGEGGSSACSDGLYLFAVAVAFDAAPTSPDAVDGEEAAAAAPEESSEPTETSSTSADGSKTISKTTTVTPPE